MSQVECYSGPTPQCHPPHNQLSCFCAGTQTTVRRQCLHRNHATHSLDPLSEQASAGRSYNKKHPICSGCAEQEALLSVLKGGLPGKGHLSPLKSLDGLLPTGLDLAVCQGHPCTLICSHATFARLQRAALKDRRCLAADIQCIISTAPACPATPRCSPQQCSNPQRQQHALLITSTLLHGTRSMALLRTVPGPCQ